MFVRYGKAAIIAATLALTGNAAWAQTVERQGCGPNCVYFKMNGGCCEDGKCCKAGECCSKSQKCEANCTCSKDDKCACCKGGECGCDNKGKCSCTEAKSGCCPLMQKLAKHTAIIMVMPPSMPLPAACCLEAMGQLAHPQLPPPHVFLPPPLPPPVAFPQVVQVNEGNCDNGTLPYNVNNLNSNGCYISSSITPAGAPVCCCTISKPAAATKIHITAASSSDQLEMNVGEGTAIHCKKMTVTVGDNEITVSRCDDRVRVRGEELIATAASICTDGKSRLILEGDVTLRYKQEGHTAKVIGEHIELNLSNGAMMIQRVARVRSDLQHPPEYVPRSPPFPCPGR